MPISLISVFMAIVVINHMGLLRVVAADELGARTLPHAPWYVGLLTGITLTLSVMLLQLVQPYTDAIPLLRILNHFIYLLVIVVVAHATSVLIYALKPLPAITKLLPLLLINGIGLGVITLKINSNSGAVINALIVATVFAVVSIIFYYTHIWFVYRNTSLRANRLSVLFLITSLFTLLLYSLITFY